MQRQWFVPGITLGAALLFWISIILQEDQGRGYQEKSAEIAISAPVQVLLYAGDRFLAANIEAIRAAAASSAPEAQSYRLRAHHEVARLNPCHEDNYWIGNAALSWGGAEEQGFELLRSAMHCRFWDEWPAFFYGFNQYFFRHNVKEARLALEQAAQRSASNAAAFRNFSIMLAAGEINDAGMALELLEREQEQATDPKLREMLGLRVTRLRGLITLRAAQKTYESRFGHPLPQPTALIESGLLSEFPEDPLGLGYEFRDHGFHLRQTKISK